MSVDMQQNGGSAQATAAHEGAAASAGPQLGDSYRLLKAVGEGAYGVV